MVGLSGRSDESQRQFLARRADSLGPRNSVSKVAVCYVSPRLTSNRRWGFEPRRLIPVRMDGSPPREEMSGVDRSLRLCRRLESERPPLIRPGHRQVDETLETKAA